MNNDKHDTRPLRDLANESLYNAVVNYVDDAREEMLRRLDERDILLKALKEARRWFGDGDCADDIGSQFWTPEYRAAVERTDAVIAQASEPEKPADGITG